MPVHISACLLLVGDITVGMWSVCMCVLYLMQQGYSKQKVMHRSMENL